MKKVLVISKGVFHPTVFCRNKLRKMLKENNGIAFDFVSTLKQLDGPDTEMYHAVVLYFHEKDITESQLKSLTAYVEKGGKLFCIHGALASFKNSDEYISLIGSRFKGHDKIRNIIVTGEYDFYIKDELYDFEISNDCNIRLMSGNTPVFWTRKQGKGTVICLSLGHRKSVFKNKNLKKLINEELMDSSEK